MNNFDYYLVVRPLFSKFERENGMPVIRKINYSEKELEECEPLNFTNISKSRNKSLILMFHHDYKLNCLWNNPLKYVSKFKKCFAVLTPDFTVQASMDLEMVRMNTYKNRWLGCTWQQYGINVIPTISWAGPETYDICFSGICSKSIVAVSTVGCLGANEKKMFLNGYNELLKRKQPKLVLVFGTLIKGMTGRVLPIEYTDSFNKQYVQIPLFELSKIINFEEVE